MLRHYFETCNVVPIWKESGWQSRYNHETGEGYGFEFWVKYIQLMTVFTVHQVVNGPNKVVMKSNKTDWSPTKVFWIRCPKKMGTFEPIMILSKFGPFSINWP